MTELGHRKPEPASLSAHRSRHPRGAWSALPPVPEKRDLRHQLNSEQDGLCIYCEELLAPDDGHIDHIVPRSCDSALVFVYTNLAHSCSTPGRCGVAKDDRRLPIEPRPGCSAYFELSITTGRLAPNRRETASDGIRARETLDILGLNDDAGLVRRRCQFAKALVVIEQQSPESVSAFLSDKPFRWSLGRLVT